LERALTIAKMIQVIETIEMEELTSAERKLYRPVWNRLLPPLEHAGKKGRRSMGSPIERYRLMLDSSETGSVVSIARKAMRNADSLREAISPEAWAALAGLRGFFVRSRFRAGVTDDEARKMTRRLSETAGAVIPQFFATAQLSMTAGDLANSVSLLKEPSQQPMRRGALPSRSSGGWSRCTPSRLSYPRFYVFSVLEMPIAGFIKQGRNLLRFWNSYGKMLKCRDR
jgi:hypothetical protein